MIITTLFEQLLADAEMGVSQHLFYYHKHDVFLMVLTSQLSALTAGNKQHMYTYIYCSVINPPRQWHRCRNAKCVIMNQTLAFHLVMKAHQINYPIIKGKLASLSCDRTIYIIITGKRAIFEMIIS